VSRPPGTDLARVLRAFFADHLPRVRGASPHTITSYRDALTLLLRFLAAHRQRDVVALEFADLAPLDILAFLDHLESARGNAVVTRNARLAAIHAFARYAAAGDPERIEQCQALLAIPFKRAERRVVEYLETYEMRAVLDAPDRETAMGRRDHALLLTLFNTGARVSELLGLRPCDLQLVRPTQVHLRGKGRKERLCPIWPETVRVLKSLLEEQALELGAASALFRNRRGEPLTRFGVRHIISRLVEVALPAAPSLARKRVHPHVIRHTTAVHLLQAGVDLVTISHWLGHASVETTNLYLAVDLAAKRDALARAHPLVEMDATCAVWRDDASILSWLESL